jgi:hypothetical protein
MPFVKGQSGNPGGRPKEKPWAEALRMALAESDNESGKKKLRLLAEAVVQKGLEGDIQAAKEIGDRLDGKAPQAITGDGEDGSFTINIVRFANGD